MKHAKHFLLMAAMLLCSISASAHDFVKNGIFYKAPRQIDLADLTVMVTYFDPDNESGYSTFKNEYRGRVVIPSTVTYEGMTFRVTRIDDYAFCECDALTSVVIPSTIVSIGESAFEGCKKLKSVALSEGLESIGYAAFRDCVSLTSIKIPNSVTEFKGSWGYNSTFEGCTNLTSVTLPKGITGIGRDRKTFEGCSKQLKINGMFYYEGIGQQVHNVTPIAPKPVSDFEFKVTANGVVLTKYNNKNKTGSLVLPEDYNGKNYDIGDDAFHGCSSLTAITIPEGVARIGDGAFYSCDNLSSISLPMSVTSIGNAAFCYCKKLKSITIPEGVVSIGNRAFSGCYNLTSISIPESVISLGDDVFSDCYNLNLTSISVAGTCGNNLTWKLDREGELIIKGTGAMNKIPWIQFNDAIKTVTITKGVTSIAPLAFNRCSNLTCITIPEGVTSIGRDAFDGCSNLTSITIPEGMRNIGDYAFRDCSSLTSITIPASVTSIGRGAFDNCYKLTSVKCPARFRSFFPRVDFSTIVGDFRFLDDGVLVGYVGRSAKVVLPKDFKGKKYHIAERAFEGNSVIKSVTISEGVVGIGTCAFKDCVNLKTVTIPESVTSMGWYVFENCSNLETVKVPQSWKLKGRLGNDAIQGCPNARVMSEKDMNFQTLQISVGAVAAVAVLVEAFKVAGKNSTE